ncbi:M15 family metallopeptidase [Lentzea sp. NPDC058450]|uniref:M15 family metallopeptidase n=1 Tax=Lentzea sp. NPDC058450 TaxID=3346505 RepID=UPI00365EA3B8
MTILLADPIVRAVRVLDNGDPLVPLDFAPGVLVREGLARRLDVARALLPSGVDLRVIEGHRTTADQNAIIERYTDELRALHPAADEVEISRLSSRFVAPLDVAPHVAGAAVDLTLVTSSGAELWMGTAVDATPEESDGRCFFAAEVDDEAQYNRAVLATVLGDAGLVNYPTEWWHWSYGDRYWALLSGADHALYGPVEVPEWARV